MNKGFLRFQKNAISQTVSQSLIQRILLPSISHVGWLGKKLTGDNSLYDGQTDEWHRGDLNGTQGVINSSGINVWMSPPDKSEEAFPTLRSKTSRNTKQRDPSAIFSSTYSNQHFSYIYLDFSLFTHSLLLTCWNQIFCFLKCLSQTEGLVFASSHFYLKQLWKSCIIKLIKDVNFKKVLKIY